VANCSWWALTSSDNSSYYKDCQQGIWEWNSSEFHPFLDEVDRNPVAIESTIGRLQIPFDGVVAIVQRRDELFHSRDQSIDGFLLCLG